MESSLLHSFDLGAGFGCQDFPRRPRVGNVGSRALNRRPPLLDRTSPKGILTARQQWEGIGWEKTETWAQRCKHTWHTDLVSPPPLPFPCPPRKESSNRDTRMPKLHTSLAGAQVRMMDQPTLCKAICVYGRMEGQIDGQ